MSAILSLIFLSVPFVVTFSFAFHYWQQGNYRIALRWTIGVCICLVAGVFFAARYYMHAPSTVIKAVVPKGRPYLVISDSRLEEPLSPGKNPVLIFTFENTGPIETTGYFRDATCTFSYFTDERFLTYIRNESGKFSLSPREKHTIRWPFGAVGLDEYKIKLLNENTATLYFFARGEYSDEAGNKDQGLH